MGPLKGIKIIEMAGLGPAPFAGMMLADMGADLILIERKADPNKFRIPDCNRRGKRSIALNLKDGHDIETLLKLVEKADVLFEGFRPNVMERLGLSPDTLQKRNPRLIIGRMTGWGQYGPLSSAAGHDINYISLTGALRAIGRKGQPPVAPLNLVGDYGGGGMFLVTGILAALVETQKSGKGQVIDVAMTDGSAVLMSVFNSLYGMGMWNTHHGSNFLDSGSHFYEVYETSDGKYISIGSLEPQFYALLLEKLGLDPEEFKAQNNPSKWTEYKVKFISIFKSKTRDDWCKEMEGTDICFAPVLDYLEAQKHPHNIARETYMKLDGIVQPSPAPRFSRTASEVKFGSRAAGENSEEILKDWGLI
ncbi:CoA transferase [bacterium]|nr:CoA transferase [bacterium]MDC3253596.1 CoA transferase [bacterium]